MGIVAGEMVEAVWLLVILLTTLQVVHCNNQHICKGAPIVQREGFHWVCDYQLENIPGNKCRLYCEGGEEPDPPVISYCGMEGWSTQTLPENLSCQSQPGCHNILKEKSFNGKWSCVHFNKHCIVPKTGSVCELLCDPGFHLNSEKNTMCKEDGWNPPIEDFRCLSCPPPMKPHNGELYCQTRANSSETFCTLTCDKGYRQEGPDMTRCVGEGSNEYQPPAEEMQCVPAKPKWVSPNQEEIIEEAEYPCPAINTPDFGRFECDGSQCRLVCNEGYSVPSVVTAKCTKGSWCTDNPGVACTSHKEYEYEFESVEA